MTRRTSRWLLVSGMFLVTAASLFAQVVPRTPPIGVSPQTQPNRGGGYHHGAAEGNAACRRILNECRRLGFIEGQWRKDNGLWRDCFDPVVKGGGTPTRDGRPISVPVSSRDVEECRAAESHRYRTR